VYIKYEILAINKAAEESLAMQYKTVIGTLLAQPWNK
jgi:hypothetical protein